MRGEPVDLGTIASSGPRATAAAAALDDALHSARAIALLNAGPALAFVVIAAEVVRTMPDDLMADALALAALRLADR